MNFGTILNFKTLKSRFTTNLSTFPKTLSTIQSVTMLEGFIVLESGQ